VARPGGVLVIEDDGPTRALLEELLAEELGAAVRGAPDGLAGLAAAADERPDLILLDLRLPGPDGFAVLRRLKASPRTAAIPVLAVTAASADATLRAIEGGCSGFVRKPFDLDALIAVVRPYVERPETRSGARTGGHRRPDERSTPASDCAAG
jgi:CheY-like chemotaxis protein